MLPRMSKRRLLARPCYGAGSPCLRYTSLLPSSLPQQTHMRLSLISIDLSGSWTHDQVGRGAFVAVHTGCGQSRRRARINGGHLGSSDRDCSGDWFAPVFCECNRRCDSRLLVLTSSMANDISLACHWVSRVAPRGVVRSGSDILILLDV